MPINFTVTHDQFASDDDSDDSGSDADVVALIGPVRFIPQFRDERPILAPDASPRPAGFKIREFTAYLDVDGQLKNRPGGTVGVRLWGNDPLFGIQKLWYKVEFGPITTPAGKLVILAGGYIEAPATDTTVRLSSALQQTGSAGIGVTRGLPGPGVDDAQLIGGDVQFYAEGTPVGDPLDLDILLFDMSTIDGGTADAEGLETLDAGGPEVSGSTLDLKRMQQRRGPVTSWTSGDPILSPAEFGVSFNPDGTIAAIKLGDGIHVWSALNDLRAWSTLTGKPAVIAAGADLAAVWSILGTVPTGNLPELAIVRFKGHKTDQAAMLATAGESGDWIIRDDNGGAYVITGSDPTQLSSWTQLPWPSLAGLQPLDATLTALAGVTTAADRLVYATGADAFGVTPFTAAGRALVDDADAAAQRATLGVAPIPTAVTTLTAATAPTPGMITLYNATAGSLAPPLLALSGLNVGDSWWVGKSDSSTNTVTFTPQSGDLFDTGAATHTVSIVERLHLQVVLVGGVKKWSVIDSHKPLPSLDTRYDARYPVVTPEMFGALGDGGDDATALRNMFLSAVTNGGVTIHIPRGKVYASSLPIDVKSNTYVFGSGTIKCLAFHPAGQFIQYKNAIRNVTWIGPAVDINYLKNMNGHGVGDVPNTTDFVDGIHIEGTVYRTRIETASLSTGGEGGVPGANQPVLYAGGGKALTVQFRARNVYCNIIAIDCDIACSVEAAVSSTRYLENVVIDLQSKDSHRTALYIAGSRDGISSANSGSYMHSLYPGVKVRLRAQGGQDGLITNPVTGTVDGNNWDNAGVVTLNYASGIDLEVYAATQSRCTLIRGMAAASTIRVTNALMDEVQDVWDTRPLDTLAPAGSVMSDNVFQANVHAAIMDGVLVRPHRDSGSPTMQRTQLDINAWCQNGVGAITQSDGTTDGFGASVAYRFCDMKSSPIKEISGFSAFNPLPQWAAAPLGGRVFLGNLSANDFVPAMESTVTSGGTLTLTVNNAPIQEFIGTNTHTAVLPTAGIKRGQTRRLICNSTNVINVQSANTNALATLLVGKILDFTARIDTPVAPTDWIITGGSAQASSGANGFGGTVLLRDNNGNAPADDFIATVTTTATSNGITVLTINSTKTQVATGILPHTYQLPTTGVVAGQDYIIISQSTGAITVQSSGANTIGSPLPAASSSAPTSLRYQALIAAPTTAAHWRAI